MTRRKSRGFTLIEILIVAALIALLSGIAIFSINEFYNNNIRKAVIGEVYQLATASSFAHDDLQFFPKLHHLSDPPSSLFKDPLTGLQDSNQLIPAIDYLGFMGGGQPVQLTKMQNGWKGPYMGMSMTRDRSSRGSRSGIVKMRLPDAYVQLAGSPVQDSLSLVDWPADVWGNPYVFYMLRSEVDAGGNLLPSFTTSLGEPGDYLNAIVSYGKNKFPGGNDFTSGDYRLPQSTVALDIGEVAQDLMAGALYIRGDAFGANINHFTLKTALDDPAIPANLKLLNGTQVHFSLLDSLKVTLAPPPGKTPCDVGYVGMQDPCNDDIVYEF